MVTGADTKAADVTAIMKEFVKDNTRLRANFEASAVHVPGHEKTPDILQETLNGVVEHMEHRMDDIKIGINNGMPIRSLKHFREFTEAAIQPVLRTIATVNDTIIVNGPLGEIEVPHDDRKSLGTHKIDLAAIEKQMLGAVNDWMKKVSELEWKDASDVTHSAKEIVGLPLAINDTLSRSADGPWGDVEQAHLLVISSNDGHIPRKMINDTEAAEKMALSAASEASRNLGEMVESHSGSPAVLNQN